MDALLAARLQMGFSLGFHIIFAVIGMVMPWLMSLSYYQYIKRNNNEALELTKIWMKGVAIFFAVGAVSGTLLSFELGLLWPKFMQHAGPIIGMPFSLEGTAFFMEAIALGIFLYGFDRISPWKHWVSSLVVGISGVLSGIFVVAVNGWMNAPTGFEFDGENFKNIDPIIAMFNKAWISEAHHMTIAAFTAVSASVLGVHAFLFLKGRRQRLNALAIKITIPLFILFSLIQPLSGDLIAKDVAQRQPLKLAAMEGLKETMKGAPLSVGGVVEIPKALSFLAYGDFNAEVKGLNEWKEEERPPTLIVQLAFQIMVMCGSVLSLVAIISLYFLIRKRSILECRPLLWAYVAMAPLGYIAIEAGWTVTEVGRQPWIIYGLMKTKDALSMAPLLQLTFFTYLFLYLFLFGVISWLFYRLVLVHFLKKDSP